MAQGLPGNLYHKLRSRINQYEATTGRRIGQSALQALMESELNVMASRSAESERLAMQKEQFAVSSALDKERMEKESRAAMVSGIGQIGGSAAQLAIMNKMLPAEDRLHPIDAAKDYISSGTSRVSDWLRPSGSMVGDASAAFAEVGANTGWLASTSGPALTGGGTVSYPYAAMASGAPEAAGATSSAVGAGFGTYAGPAAAGLVAGKISGSLFAHNQKTLGKLTPWGGTKTEATMGGVMGGAGAGFLVGGPVGAVIGGVIGAVSGGSVICTELMNQGYISRHTLILDGVYRVKYIDEDTYNGYLKWAKYVVRWMSRSELVTYLVAPFGVAWAREMAHRVVPELPGSILGKILNFVGVPICRLIGRWS